MNQKIKKMLDKRLSGVSDKINKQWFYEFFELFSKFNYDGDITSVFDALFNTKAINQMEMHPPRFLVNSTASKRNLKQFMDYLNNKLSNLTDDEVQEFFDELVEYFDENIDEDISSSTRLVKYITLKFSKDVQIHIQNQEKFLDDPENNNLYIGAKLGEFNLASMKARKGKETKTVYFDHLRTFRGLERQHLGYMVMYEFLRFMKYYMPEMNARGMGVTRHNFGAQNFYDKLGAVFYSELTLETIPFNKLSEYTTGSFGVYFDKRKIKQFINSAEMVEALSLEHHLRRQREMRERHERFMHR